MLGSITRLFGGGRRLQQADGQRRLALAGMAQLRRPLQLQAPRRRQRAGQHVLLRDALAVEIQPPLPLQLQRTGFRMLVAACPIHQLQLVLGAHPVGRQLTPVLGHTRLLRVHSFHTFHLRHMQVVVPLVGPDLLIGRTGRQGQLGRGLHLAGIHFQVPVAGLQLHLQPTVRVEACRQVAAQRLRHAVGQQCSRQLHLARLAGDVQFIVRRHLTGHPIVDPTADQHRHRVADHIRFCGRARCLQPHMPVAIHHRCHRLAIGHHRQRAHLGRHPHQLRIGLPLQRARQYMLSGRQQHLRLIAAARHHQRLPLAVAHLGGPAARLARQHHCRRCTVDRHGQREARLPAVDDHGQMLGPHAGAAACLIMPAGAGQHLVPLHRPGYPFLQLPRQAVGAGGDGGRGGG